MRSVTLIFLIITITQALGQAMADIYLPSFPAMAESFNTPIQNIEFSLTIFALGYGFSQIFYGPLSDAIGRRKPMLTGLFLGTLGSFICYIAPTIEMLMVGRIFQALGAGATLTIGGAMFRDLFEGTTLAKYTSYSGIVFVIFLALAPLLGGYIQTFIGWRANFAFIMACSFLAFIAFIFIPETNRYITFQNLHYSIVKQNVKTLIKHPIFIGYTICSLLTYGAILAWITTGPALLENVVGLTPIQYGWVYAITGIAFAVGAFVNSFIVPKYGINKILLVGLLGMLLSGVIMLIFKLMGFINTPVIVGPAILLSFAASFVFPNTAAGLFDPFPDIAGITSALFYSSRLLGGALFSGLIVLMPHDTQAPMAIALIAGAIFSLLAFYFTIQKQPY